MSPDGTIDVELDPEDIILLLLQANQELLGKRFLAGITRLEKLLFLLQKETDFEGIGRFFVFTAHNFGPFSKEVYEATEFLDSCGLVRIQERTYPSYYANVGERLLLNEISDTEPEEEDESVLASATEKMFALTPDGMTVAGKLREAVKARRPTDISQLNEVVRRYGTLSLSQLIRYVYRRYPGMTEKSIHPEAYRMRARGRHDVD